MQVDYIIVGLGLAGLAFAETLEQHKKSFVVFNDNFQRSSKVAAGSYNPIILKRFTPVWDAEDQLKIALPFYKSLERKFNKKYDRKLDILRVFTSIEEQNDWFAVSDKPVLRDYMLTEVVKNFNKGIIAPLGFGKIVNTGKILIKDLIEDYEKHLLENDKLYNQTFDYNLIKIVDKRVNYNDINAKRIVFCEGFGIKQNPYFNNLPMQEAKGELLTIHAPTLDLKVMLKSSAFILPLGNDLYKVGTTFNWQDKTSNPSVAGREELLNKVDKVIKAPYQVVDHVAGIRPTVKDRRPLLGVHNQYKQLAILNGLGTRGVMLAPKMAGLLFNYLENKELLPNEVSINRFG